jgi:hypothetical protein
MILIHVQDGYVAPWQLSAVNVLNRLSGRRTR